ncbi:hypothetical protein [Rathayibacter sp. VKM Ac-2760]|uniref:hypothetical protein n=1 Tax=Rathayibacter sp. VKM Ac-2760 TaxID=2609253 RepID=UPI0013181681|nr:hypothetical protein [Rathayibacter sp. VKM Ac-2760]QHC60433.1 hypothetical protein GSU72_19155 [Rathayibacter sp. VKM Ac-2760]
MPVGEIRYETKTVTTIRGRESRSITKWEKEGWEFLSQQEQPMLRTSLTFRRVKPKPPWLLVGGVGGVLVILAAVITVMSLITGDDEEPATPSAAPTSAAPAQTPTSAPTQAPAAVPTEVPADVSTYNGVPYEILSTERGQSSADLTQYWVFAEGLEASTTAGRDQIKAIINDVARAEGSSALFVEVVSDRDIALAESPSTYEAFIAERGLDYAQKTIPEIEKTGWLAAYAGGFDYDTGEASDSAFEITWLVASDDPDFEAWQAIVTG